MSEEKHEDWIDGILHTETYDMFIKVRVPNSMNMKQLFDLAIQIESKFPSASAILTQRFHDVCPFCLCVYELYPCCDSKEQLSEIYALKGVSCELLHREQANGHDNFHLRVKHGGMVWLFQDIAGTELSYPEYQDMVSYMNRLSN